MEARITSYCGSNRIHVGINPIADSNSLQKLNAELRKQVFYAIPGMQDRKWIVVRKDNDGGEVTIEYKVVEHPELGLAVEFLLSSMDTEFNGRVLEMVAADATRLFKVEMERVLDHWKLHNVVAGMLAEGFC